MAEVSALAFDRDGLRQITRKLTMMDPLTQVYGYSYFHRRLSEEVERAQRLNECLSVMLLEIDNLRAFRETNGWQATEQVLAISARSRPNRIPQSPSAESDRSTVAKKFS